MDDEKTVKTSDSIRETVIHDALLAIGFLDYVAKIRKKHGKDS
jgi:hypothetical protein